MITLVLTAIRVYQLMMILHIILEWVIPINERRNSKVFSFIDSACQPALAPIRKNLVKLFPPIMNMRIDISPIIFFFLLNLIEGFIRMLFY